MYFRTPGGVLITPKTAGTRYANQDLKPVLDVRSENQQRRDNEKAAVDEYQSGKLTKAERFALRKMLERIISTEEAAAKVSCEPILIAMMAAGFTNRVLASRIRGILKNDYMAAIAPRPEGAGMNPGKVELKRWLQRARQEINYRS